MSEWGVCVCQWVWGGEVYAGDYDRAGGGGGVALCGADCECVVGGGRQRDGDREVIGEEEHE